MGSISLSNDTLNGSKQPMQNFYHQKKKKEKEKKRKMGTKMQPKNLIRIGIMIIPG